MAWWFKTRFGSSFLELFGTSSPTYLDEPLEAVSVEDIRARMLILLEGINEPQAARRVRYAADVQGLWYMRGELLGVLARHRGEASAFEKVDALTPLFRGALPQGLVPRHSPLNSGARRSAGDSV